MSDETDIKAEKAQDGDGVAKNEITNDIETKEPKEGKQRTVSFNRDVHVKRFGELCIHIPEAVHLLIAVTALAPNTINAELTRTNSLLLLSKQLLRLILKYGTRRTRNHLY